MEQKRSNLFISLLDEGSEICVEANCGYPRPDDTIAPNNRNSRHLGQSASGVMCICEFRHTERQWAE